MFAGGHQARNMGHIHQQLGADRVGNGAQGGEIDDARIGRSAGHDHLRFVLLGQGLQRVIVDALRFRVYAIGHNLVLLAGKVYRAAVGQMPAMGKVHAQNGIANVQGGEIGGHVGLGAAMRLHIDKARAKQLFGPVAGQVFGHVHPFATAIIAFARVAFRIFIGHYRALGFHYRTAGKVFRSNQLQLVLLAFLFVLNCGKNFRVHILQSDLFNHSLFTP